MYTIRQYMKLLEDAGGNLTAAGELARLSGMSEDYQQHPESYLPAILKFAKATVLEQLSNGGGNPEQEIPAILSAMAKVSANDYQAFAVELTRRFRRDPNAQWLMRLVAAH